jgi:hypothetical protein
MGSRDVQTAMSSKYVFIDGGRPRSARRFEAASDSDSGWCFLSGHRDEDAPGFGDEPSNFRRNTLAELVDYFSELAEILDAPVDSEFEWNDEQATYRLSYKA